MSRSRPTGRTAWAIRGIARDLAAAGLGTLKPTRMSNRSRKLRQPAVEIRVEDPEGCPAFYGRRRFADVTNGPSPEWLQRRLKAAGQRPISALVDITNYRDARPGRPAHAYDIKELSGAHSVAPQASDGERFLALNEKEYALDPSMTVIADEAQAHDLGGDYGRRAFGRSAKRRATTLLEICLFHARQHRRAPGRSCN